MKYQGLDWIILNFAYLPLKAEVDESEDQENEKDDEVKEEKQIRQSKNWKGWRRKEGRPD